MLVTNDLRTLAHGPCFVLAGQHVQQEFPGNSLRPPYYLAVSGIADNLHLYDGALCKIWPRIFHLKFDNVRTLLLAEQQKDSLLCRDDESLAPDIKRCDFVGAFLEHRLDVECTVHHAVSL